MWQLLRRHVLGKDLCLKCLGMFGLFQLALIGLSGAHVLHTFSPTISRPTLIFVLALLALYGLFATGTAIWEVARQRRKQKQQQQDKKMHWPQPHRLRPLLFLTNMLTVFGLAALWLLPFMCRHFVLSHWLVSAHLCPLMHPFASSMFPTVVLSLLLTAVVPLRPMVQQQLNKRRQSALRAYLLDDADKDEDITAAIGLVFNQFCEQLEKLEQEQNQTEEDSALFQEWRVDFGRKLRQDIERRNQRHTSKLASGNSMCSKKLRSKHAASILRKSEKGRRPTRHFKQNEEGVQFSEVLMLREVSSVQNEAGQLMQIDKHQKFVLESLYADFVRDFRARMTPRGRIAPKSTRQILCRFAPLETVHYSRHHYAAGNGGITACRSIGAGRTVGGGRKTPARVPEVEDRDYATIDGEEGGSGGDSVLPLTTSTATMMMPFPLMPQRRPRLPTTPIPRSTPASLLASPSTPQQDQQAMLHLPSANATTATLQLPPSVIVATTKTKSIVLPAATMRPPQPLPRKRGGGSTLPLEPIYENVNVQKQQQNLTDSKLGKMVVSNSPAKTENLAKMLRTVSSMTSSPLADCWDAPMAITPQTMLPHNQQEEGEQMNYFGHRKPTAPSCWCPLGEHCQTGGAEASTHYYVLSPGGTVLNMASGDGDDDTEDNEEDM